MKPLVCVKMNHRFLIGTGGLAVQGMFDNGDAERCMGFVSANAWIFLSKQWLNPVYGYRPTSFFV